MRSVLLLFAISLCVHAFGQEVEPDIDFLKYAGKKIAIPKGCVPSSETDIRGCGHQQVQWYTYTNMKELDTSFPKLIAMAEKGREKSEFNAISFGAVMTGYRITVTYGSSNSKAYLFYLKGLVNNNAILLEISSNTDITKNADLGAIPSLLIKIE
jgi:hypothetical protein